MSEETDARWLCHRCVKKEGATVDADPVLLRVCDGCQVENYVRLARGVIVERSDEEIEALNESARETIVAESVEVVGEVVVESVIEEVAPEPEDPKKAEIEALKAQIAELEK